MKTIQKKMLILFPFTCVESFAIDSGLIIYRIRPLFPLVIMFQVLGILMFNAAVFGRMMRWWK